MCENYIQYMKPQPFQRISEPYEKSHEGNHSERPLALQVLAVISKRLTHISDE